jgi:hypothetical protein
MSRLELVRSGWQESQRAKQNASQQPIAKWNRLLPNKLDVLPYPLKNVLRKIAE